MRICDNKAGLWIALAVALVTALSVAGAFGHEPHEMEEPIAGVGHD